MFALLLLRHLHDPLFIFDFVLAMILCVHCAKGVALVASVICVNFLLVRHEMPPDSIEYGIHVYITFKQAPKRTVKAPFRIQQANTNNYKYNNAAINRQR